MIETSNESTKELVDRRLREADSKWNQWPNLPIVSLERFDLNDAQAAFEYGWLQAHARTYRQHTYNTMPSEVQQAMPWRYSHPSERTLIYCWWDLTSPAGQEDEREKRNLRCIIDATGFKIWNRKPDSPAFAAHGLIVTVGCTHDYDDAGSNHQRGLHRGRCRKCGHRFLCDSGD